MEHLELHLINNEFDALSAINVGLLEDLSELACDNCEEPIAEYQFEFYPFVVILNEDDESWLVCEECSSPILYPATFDSQDENI